MQGQSPLFLKKDIPADLANFFEPARCGACYVCHSVMVLREIRRVLRKDGVVFWNIGDSYAGSGKAGSNPEYQKRHTEFGKPSTNTERFGLSGVVPDGTKPKDLCLIPARVAIAAQADGWYVRSWIIWNKPNPMPESCTDRPTSAWETILMLTKSSRYFYDIEAVREKLQTNEKRTERIVYAGKSKATSTFLPPNSSGRNLRNVWTLTTQPSPLAHFATFPEEIPRRCIKAATSPKGACPACGSPWERVVEKSGSPHDGKTASAYEVGSSAHRVFLMRQSARERGEEYASTTTTLGFRPTCNCGIPEARNVPCIVLDPFAGTGTTIKVAKQENRRGIGLDLSTKYLEMAKQRTRGIQHKIKGLE